jgi:hypothetical protein
LLFGEILNNGIPLMNTLRTTRLYLCTRLTRFAALLVALLIPSLVFAQNCALCYTQAAGSGARMIQALKSGILVLMIPPMGICIGLAIMAYRKRNQFNEDVSNSLQ